MSFPLLFEHTHAGVTYLVLVHPETGELLAKAPGGRWRCGVHDVWRLRSSGQYAAPSAA